MVNSEYCHFYAGNFYLDIGWRLRSRSQIYLIYVNIYDALPLIVLVSDVLAIIYTYLLSEIDQSGSDHVGKLINELFSTLWNLIQCISFNYRKFIGVLTDSPKCVLMRPGAMQLTRIFLGDRSYTNALVRPYIQVTYCFTEMCFDETRCDAVDTNIPGWEVIYQCLGQA